MTGARICKPGIVEGLGAMARVTPPVRGVRTRCAAPSEERARMSNPDDSPAPEQQMDAPGHPPVLLVEDDDVHALIVQASLAKVRLANPVVRARTGDEAVSYLEGLPGGAPQDLPALILLDLELPGRSGLSVLETLVALEGPTASIPVIMMSASSDNASIARARELGVRGYLVKPVAFEALADLVHRLGLRWAIVGDGPA